MAAGTASVDIVTANYVLLGTAPLILQQSSGPGMVVAVAASLPAANAPGLSIAPGRAPLSITGASNVYGRAIRSAGKVIVATLA